MLAVDEMYDDLAMLEKDLYWDAAEARAPYTAATAFLLQQPSFQDRKSTRLNSSHDV